MTAMPNVCLTIVAGCPATAAQPVDAGMSPNPTCRSGIPRRFPRKCGDVPELYDHGLCQRRRSLTAQDYPIGTGRRITNAPGFKSSGPLRPLMSRRTLMGSRGSTISPIEKTFNPHSRRENSVSRKPPQLQLNTATIVTYCVTTQLVPHQHEQRPRSPIARSLLFDLYNLTP